MLYRESENGLLLPPARNGHESLTEADTRYQAMMALAEATIVDLRAQLNDPAWRRLSEGGGQEFSREDVLRIALESRAYYLKNPMVRKACDTTVNYVHGQDLSINAADDGVRGVIDRFWKDNRATLTSQQATRLTEIELQCTGNLFLALFPNSATGQVLVRQVPIDEVTDIVTNPEDRAEVRYYRRRWTERAEDGLTTTEREAFHPDWRYVPKNRLAELDGRPILWDVPIAHQKCGAFPHWKWGVSPVYPALDWARAYKETLENDATRSAALARFAYKLTTTGGAKGVAAAQARISSTLGNGSVERNPPPAAGSTFVRNQDNDLEAVDISRSMMPSDHARPIRLFASAALGIPDHFFDADVGNYATSKTLDRPTELRFSEMRQDRKDFYEDLSQWVIDADLRASRGMLPKTIDDDARKVTFSWPSLLEKSITEQVQAIVDAATLSGRTPAGTIPDDTVSRELMSALGIDDVDGEIKKLQDERDARDAQIARQQPTQPTGVTGPTGGTGATGHPRVAEAAKPKDAPDWEDELEITDQDLVDATDAFDRWVPRAKGLLDAKVTGDGDDG